MKITKRQLRRIIKEEKQKLVKEFGSEEYGRQTKEFEPIAKIDGAYGPDFDGAYMDLDDYESFENAVVKAVDKFVQMGYQKEDVVEALKSIIEDTL